MTETATPTTVVRRYSTALQDYCWDYFCPVCRAWSWARALGTIVCACGETLQLVPDKPRADA